VWPVLRRLFDALVGAASESRPLSRACKARYPKSNNKNKTIEEKDPVLLEKMIPVVARFMKRYFQEQKYDRMYPILDRFQRRFPGIIVSLLANASDTVMFGILPSQYSAFVQMLKLMKQRLENINRSEDWVAFFVGFKRKHMGKKRLMQMINLLGDSSWNMESIFAGQKKNKR